MLDTHATFEALFERPIEKINSLNLNNLTTSINFKDVLMMEVFNLNNLAERAKCKALVIDGLELQAGYKIDSKDKEPEPKAYCNVLDKDQNVIHSCENFGNGFAAVLCAYEWVAIGRHEDKEEEIPEVIEKVEEIQEEVQEPETKKEPFAWK